MSNDHPHGGGCARVGDAARGGHRGDPRLRLPHHDPVRAGRGLQRQRRHPRALRQRRRQQRPPPFLVPQQPLDRLRRHLWIRANRDHFNHRKQRYLPGTSRPRRHVHRRGSGHHRARSRHDHVLQVHGLYAGRVVIGRNLCGHRSRAGGQRERHGRWRCFTHLSGGQGRYQRRRCRFRHVGAVHARKDPLAHR